MNSNGNENSADQLREVVGRAEQLLGSIGASGDAAVAELRRRAKSTVRSAKERLNVAQGQARDLADDAVKSTDAYVQANPWTAIAIAAAVGVVVGALVSRRI